MNPKVLVVEDNEAELPLYLRCIGEQYDTSCVNTVEEAVDHLRTGEYALCLTDYILCDGTAKGILREAGPQLCGTPIVVATGSQLPDLSLRVLEMGAADYIPKQDMTPALVQRCFEHVLVREKINKQLRLKATEDALTGLVAQDCFNKHLRLEINRYKRHGTPSSLVMIDIDQLGLVKEIYGRRTADKALQHISTLIQGTTRMLDVATRTSCDRFALLLPETSQSEAKLMAKRLLQLISAKPLGLKGQLLSFGARASVSGLQQMISQADHWTYLASSALEDGWNDEPPQCLRGWEGATLPRVSNNNRTH
jgi:diguanylate cyclase (GGDEF)-like protein